MGSEPREGQGWTPWRTNYSIRLRSCDRRSCMRYLWIYTRTMTIWTGGMPCRYWKGMGWYLSYANSWSSIGIRPLWYTRRAGIIGTPFRVPVVSPRGAQFPPGYAILWWALLFATGLGWWRRTIPDLVALVTRWKRRRIFLRRWQPPCLHQPSVDTAWFLRVNRSVWESWDKDQHGKDGGNVVPSWDYLWEKIFCRLWAVDDWRGGPPPCEAAPEGGVWGIWVGFGRVIHGRPPPDSERSASPVQAPTASIDSPHTNGIKGGFPEDGHIHSLPGWGVSWEGHQLH